ELTSAQVPQDRLATWAARTKVPYIDLLPAFKAHPSPATLYFENDDHLSNEGHLEAYQWVRQKFLEPFLSPDN
ncbi:MAG: SGNH/GDSL hydrolase family protein, partial [Bacteroidota bacterium]